MNVLIEQITFLFYLHPSTAKRTFAEKGRNHSYRLQDRFALAKIEKRRVAGQAGRNAQGAVASAVHGRAEVASSNARQGAVTEKSRVIRGQWFRTRQVLAVERLFQKLNQGNLRLRMFETDLFSESRDRGKLAILVFDRHIAILQIIVGNPGGERLILPA